MKPTDPLFDLIHSLKREEKRHFKLYIKKYGAVTNYLQLFETIDKMRVYDEAQLIKLVSSQSYAKRLGVAKEYLYSVILRSLRDIERETPEAKATSLIQDARILLERRLYALAKKKIRKAEILAETHELIGHRFIVADLKAYLPDVDRKQLFDETNDILRSTSNLLQVGSFAEELRAFREAKVYVRTSEDSDALEAIVARYSNIDPSILSPSGAIRFHFGWARYYDLRRKPEQALRHEIAIIDCYESNPGLIINEQLGYVLGLLNICTLGLRLEKPEIVQNYRQRLDTLSVQPSVKPYRDMLAFRFDLLFALSRKDWNSVEQLRAKLDRLLIDCNMEANSYGKDIRIEYYLSFAKAYLAQRDFQKALRDTLSLLQLPTLADSPYLENTARVLLLITHYELGNTAYLPYLIRSTYRALLKRKTLFAFESVLLRYLRSLSKVKTKRETAASFSALRAAIKEPGRAQDEPDLPWLSIVEEWLDTKPA